ncbi:MAG TPA: hypothetical protein VIM11_09950 [Tepidisphaeraceae bacterium]
MSPHEANDRAVLHPPHQRLAKKVENCDFNLALHFMQYNFCRVRQSIRITPAMAARPSDHAWELEELVGLIG